MAKKKSQGAKKIKKVLHEFKGGKLYTSAGKKVTNPDQAVAIAISEAKNQRRKSKRRSKKS